MDVSTQLINEFVSINTHLKIPTLIPTLINEEKWSFEQNSLDLIVSNMNLHWINKIENTFNLFHQSLRPDGVLLGIFKQ